MTIQELQTACDLAEAAALKYGSDAGFPLVLNRRCSGGRRMSVAPGLLGEVMCENSDGRTVVRVKASDVRRWIARHGLEAAP